MFKSIVDYWSTVLIGMAFITVVVWTAYGVCLGLYRLTVILKSKIMRKEGICTK
jgi:hypothetical protein